MEYACECVGVGMHLFYAVLLTFVIIQVEGIDHLLMLNNIHTCNTEQDDRSMKQKEQNKIDSHFLFKSIQLVT